MPVRQEPAERGLLGGLDLLPQRGKRRTPQATQHVRITPLALGSTGTELAAEELLLSLELLQQGLDVPSEALVCLRSRERPASARITRHELFE